MIWAKPKALPPGMLDPVCTSFQHHDPARRGAFVLDTVPLAKALETFTKAVQNKEPPDVAAVMRAFAGSVHLGVADNAEMTLAGPPVRKGTVADGPEAQDAAIAAFQCQFPAMADPVSDAEGPTKIAMGIVDFSIAFLNRRFRKKDGTTRFEMLWLQDREMSAPAEFGAIMGSGTLLLRDDINALIARHTIKGGRVDEDAAYGEILHPGRGQRDPLTLRVGHGTAILDQMAGDEPGAQDDIALYGVELPSSVVADTSGSQLMSPLLAGLTAIGLWSYFVPVSRQHSPWIPLFMNASLAFTGGPCSTRNPNAQVLSGLMEALRAHAYDKRQIELTIPIGNHLQDQIYARLAAGDRRDIGWVIAPDDRTPTALELFQDGVSELTLTSVGIALPGRPEIAVDVPGPGQFVDLEDTDGNAIARLARPAAMTGPFLEHWVDHLVLTVRATARVSGPEVVAPAGIWRISVDTPRDDCLLWIRRDDTLKGFIQSGRQSRFYDPAYRRFDDAGDFALEDDPMHDASVSRGQTASALAHATGQNGITAVVARRHRAGQYATYPFAGAVKPGMKVEAAPAQDSRNLGGVLCAARATGQVGRLSGTSLASARWARTLAQRALSDGQGPPNLDPPHKSRDY